MSNGTKGFIDFILAAEESMELTQAFLKAKTSKKLKAFFDKNGFEGVTKEDCTKIAKAMKGLPPDVIGPEGITMYRSAQALAGELSG